MKPLLAVLLLLMGSSVFPSMPDVDRYVTEKIDDHLIPGLALVVIRNGEVVHRRGFGELDSTRPIIIGSLSKAITATAVMTLVEDGRSISMRRCRATSPRSGLTIRQWVP